MSSPTARLAVAVTALALTATGCVGPSGDADPEERPSGVVAGGFATRSVSDTGAQSDQAAVEHLPIGAGWGPSPADLDRARTLVDGLTLRERAGQVIVASYSGTAPPTALVRRLHLGGVIVFSANVVSPDQVRRSNRAVQQAVRASKRRWPALIGVDQEGGRVARVQRGLTRFPGLMTAGAAGDPTLTRRAYAASGAELAGLGFTTDFAPDADVTMGASDPAIGARSAGSSPEQVTRHVLAAMRGFASAGVTPVIKHFPGHGSVSTDSHVGLPVQRKSVRALDSSDWVPFRAGIGAGTSSVMVGHLDVRAVDPGMPSSLSRKVVSGLLRDELGFDGVVFTDSLVMAAVADRFGTGGAAVRALRAGADVLLMPGDPAVARDAVVAAVRTGRLDQRRLDQAATRGVALALHQRARKRVTRAAGSSDAVSDELSARALTSVAGPCSGRLVGPSVRVSGSGPAVETFRAAAAAAGLTVAGKPPRKRPKRKTPTPTTVRLLGAGASPARGDVVVATDTPYVLGPSSARVAKLATYNDTPGAMRALVSVLLGRSSAPGRLPVDVAGVSRTGC